MSARVQSYTALVVALGVSLITLTLGASGVRAEPRPPARGEAMADDAAALESPAPAKAAAHAPTLLVLPLAGDVDARVRALVEGAVTRGAKEGHPSEVVTYRDVAAALEAGGEQHLDGSDCAAEGCMVKIAAAVDAEVALGGSIRSVGDDLLISLLLVDVASGTRLGEAQRKLSDNPLLIERVLTATVRDLVARRPLTDTATVLVTLPSNVASAMVTVDDGEATRYQSPVLLEVAAGPHRLAVDVEGYAPYKSELTLDAGAALAIEIDLVRPRVPLWPAAAILGGAAVASLAVGLAFELLASDAYWGLGIVHKKGASYDSLRPASSAELASLEWETKRWSYTAWSAYTVAGLLAATGIAVGVADGVWWALEE